MTRLLATHAAHCSRLVGLFLFLLLSPCFRAAAQTTGIYESYLILNVKEAGNTYYDLGAVTGNPDFQNADLGVFSSGQTLKMVGAQNKTYKCSGGDITGGLVNYRVYLQGGSGAAFSSVSMNFLSNDAGGCGGNQTWEVNSGSANILQGLIAGTYVLEVYTEAPGSPATAYSSNGGANFKATFKVATTLPVSLLRFSGRHLDRCNELSWATASEANNSGFVVERSADGHSFARVGFVASGAAGGNSSTELTYSFREGATDGHNWYYRLRQTDLDGKGKYSSVLKIGSGKCTRVTLEEVYPNPATSSMQVRLQAPVSSGSLLLQLSDEQGRIVKLKNVHVEAGNATTVSMDVTELAAGLYHLKAVSGDGSASAATTVVKQ
jgi:hypothetical protein